MPWIIIHTDEKIASNDEPVKAIRKKKQASMVLAAQAVKEGRADAIFSAGNTGALLAAGLFIVGRIKGIERPGLMSTLPVMTGNQGFDMLDLGANADNKPEHLLQYGILGSFYAKNVRGIANPRVGLLNKTIEGTAANIMSVLKEAILSSGIKGKMGALLLKESLRDVKGQMDYAQYGGAVLFGLKAPVIKTHGATGPEAVANTIKQIHTMLDTRVVPKLVAHFEAEKNAEQ